MSTQYTTGWLMQHLARKAAVSKPAVDPDATIKNEAALHELILLECKRRQWLAIHGRMDCASSVTIGTPDFIILAENKILMIEAKTKTGKHSTAQLAFAIWAQRLGHVVHTCRSFEDFLKLL